MLFTLDHNSDPIRCQLTSMLADFVLDSHKVSALHPSDVEFELLLRGSFSQQAACVSAGPQGALASHPHPAEEARAAAAQPQASHRRRPAVSSTAVCEADTHTRPTHRRVYKDEWRSRGEVARRFVNDPVFEGRRLLSQSAAPP